MNTPPRILITEDDPLLSVALQDKLAGAGYEVVSAEDGLAALELLKSSTFDLMILDIMMPHLDGFGLLRTLSQQGIPQPIVVAITNLPEEVLTVRLAELHVDRHFIKSETPLEDIVAYVKGKFGGIPA